jgi:RNA 2',3'-cyclic 3'-phosphodiesterase
MKRIFAAIKIHPSEKLVSLLFHFQLVLRDESIKWVDHNNIHITLKFFGETEDYRISEIITQLKMVSTKHLPFKIQLKGTGVFGSVYNPRVIWIGINESQELKNLSTDVLNAAAIIGWDRDRQNFVPHITAGRIKSIDNKANLNEIITKNKNHEIHEENVESFYLYESILQPRGPIYNILETFRLT